jgi:hypothetical protein
MCELFEDMVNEAKLECKREIAKNLIGESMSYEQIAKVTGLPLEELQELPRPSQVLCKPSEWCRIGAPDWRFTLWQERNVVLKKRAGGQQSEKCFPKAM